MGWLFFSVEIIDEHGCSGRIGCFWARWYSNGWWLFLIFWYFWFVGSCWMSSTIVSGSVVVCWYPLRHDYLGLLVSFPVDAYIAIWSAVVWGVHDVAFQLSLEGSCWGWRSVSVGLLLGWVLTGLGFLCLQIVDLVCDMRLCTLCWYCLLYLLLLIRLNRNGHGPVSI